MQERTFEGNKKSFIQAQFTLIWETLGQTGSSSPLRFPAGVGWGLCFPGQRYMPHVLGSIQKWKKTFKILFYLWIVGASEEKKAKKKIVFLKIFISNLDKKWIENSLKSSVKTWRRLCRVHLRKQQTQLPKALLWSSVHVMAWQHTCNGN